ncbi:MAG: type 1 glutamine amidotransferase, partial [Terriglobia bacterium]
QQFPFLRRELSLIEDALRREKPILGVCLGSQLLASALGSSVRKGRQKEIGWYEVALVEGCDALCEGLGHSLTAYHWHGDVFDVPPGSVRLASSRLTDCQAFRYGKNVYGFLFHMEITPAILRGMTAQFADELRVAGLERDRILGQADEYLPPLEAAGRKVFHRWAALLDE